MRHDSDKTPSDQLSKSKQDRDKSLPIHMSTPVGYCRHMLCGRRAIFLGSVLDDTLAVELLVTCISSGLGP